MALSPITAKIFYVYLHRRASDGSVFYVGKGKCGRAKSHQNRNPYWHHIVAKHGHTVEIYRDGLDQHCAHSIERILIAAIGRDRLCNLTDGGEGMAGHKQSKDQREANSERAKKRTRTPEWREFMQKLHTGRKHTEEARKKMSESAKISASKRTPEHCKNISNAKKGVPLRPEVAAAFNARKKRRPVICSNGMQFESIKAAARWLRGNGFPKAADAPIIRCCKPEWPQYKTAYGLTWWYAEAPMPPRGCLA